MALMTNRLKLTFNQQAFQNRFAVYQVRKTGRQKISLHSLIYDLGFEGAALSLAATSKDAAYILTPPVASAARQLQKVYDNAAAQYRESEDLDAYAISPANVSELKHATIAQLLLNALAAKESTWANVSGRLYKIVKHQKNQIICLEIQITNDTFLIPRVRTFTRRSCFGEAPLKRPQPRYSIDFATRSMRRILPDEAVPDEDAYILKQFHGRKNEVKYLQFTSMEEFTRSKCGIVKHVIDTYNKEYSGVAHMALESLDGAWETIALPAKLEAANITAALRGRQIKVEDCTASHEGSLCKNILEENIENLDLDCIYDEPTSEVPILRLIHEKKYYEENKISDPHEKTPPAVQHITVEAVKESLEDAGSTARPQKNKGKQLSIILQKCITELAVKNDIKHQKITLVDWPLLSKGDEMVFALPIKIRTSEEKEKQTVIGYGFLVVDATGKTGYREGLRESILECNEWDLLADTLGQEWNSRTEYAIILNGAIATVESTNCMPLPDIDPLVNEIEKVDWIIDKDSFIEIMYKHLETLPTAPAMDIIESVCTKPGSKLTSRTLVKTVGEATKGMSNAREVRTEIKDILLKEHGKPLQATITRNQQTNRRTIESLCNMHIATDGQSLFYWVNSFKPVPLGGYARAAAIRKINLPDSEKASRRMLEVLAATTALPVVRHNDSTVKPFPLKYLRECMLLESEYKPPTETDDE